MAKDTLKTGEVLLYGPIASSKWWDDDPVVTPREFKKDLDALGELDELNIFINSEGGSVFAGQAIHSMIKRHKAKKTVYVDGLAASIASVIAMAGDCVKMPKNAMMMIHQPWTYSVGNAKDFRKMADDLDQVAETGIAVYLEKTGMDREKLIELLDAETWLTAEQALELGFIDEIEESKAIAASLDGDFLMMGDQRLDVSRYKNKPNLPKQEKPAPEPEPKPEPNNPVKDDQANENLISLYKTKIELSQKKFKYERGNTK